MFENLCFFLTKSWYYLWFIRFVFCNSEWQYLTEVKKKNITLNTILKMCFHSIAVLLGCLLRDIWSDRIYLQEILDRQKFYIGKKKKKKLDVLWDSKFKTKKCPVLVIYVNTLVIKWHSITWSSLLTSP